MVNEHVGITLDVLPGTMAGITAALGGFNELVAATSMFASAVGKSTSVVDSMVLTLGVGLAGAAWESAKAFGELERGMKIVQAVSGQTSSQISVLTNKANEFSVKYKMGIDDMTAGLQTLGRAGLSSVNNQIDTLQAGLQAAKIQGMGLDDALNKIVQTTALLGGDIQASDFGQQAQALTDKLLATAMSAPIDLNDVVQTLSYSGGTAAAAGINIQNPDALYDYLGTISAFAQKGVTGSMAGTAMRAFFTKPASQDTSVVEALGKLDMKASDLWKDGGNAMRPVSEQIELIHKQMEKLNMSTLDQIELWGKIVGPKMGQQMMKLNADTIKDSAKTIRETASAEVAAETSMSNFLSSLDELGQRGQRTWREYGQAALTWIQPIIDSLNTLHDLLGGFKVGGFPIFQQFVKAGIVIIISQVIQRLGNVWQLFKNVGAELKNILSTGSQSKRSIEEQANAQRRQYEQMGLTEKQAKILVDDENRLTSSLSTSNKVMAEFLVKLNEAVALMSELANLSKIQSMNTIGVMSAAQYDRFYSKGKGRLVNTAWYDEANGNKGHLTRNEFAQMSLRHGMSANDLKNIYYSGEFQQYARNNQSGKYQFANAISLEKYLQENQKGMYDPSISPVMALINNIKTDTGIIATESKIKNKEISNQQSSARKDIQRPSKDDKKTSGKKQTQKEEKQKQEEEKQKQEEEKQTQEKKKQTQEEKKQTQEEEKQTKNKKTKTQEENKQVKIQNELTKLEELKRQLASAEAEAYALCEKSLVNYEREAAETGKTTSQLHKEEQKLNEKRIYKLKQLIEIESFSLAEERAQLQQKANAELQQLQQKEFKQYRLNLMRNHGILQPRATFPSQAHIKKLESAQLRLLAAQMRIEDTPITGATEKARREAYDLKYKQLEQIEGKRKQINALLESEKQVLIQELPKVEATDNLLKQANVNIDKEVITHSELNQLLTEYKNQLTYAINSLKGTNTSGDYLRGSYTNRNITRRHSFRNLSDEELANIAKDDKTKTGVSAQALLSNRKALQRYENTLSKIDEDPKQYRRIISEQLKVEEKLLSESQQRLAEEQKTVNLVKQGNNFEVEMLAYEKQRLANLLRYGINYKEKDWTRPRMAKSENINADILNQRHDFAVAPLNEKIRLTKEKIAQLEKQIEDSTRIHLKKTETERAKIDYEIAQQTILQQNITKLKKLEKTIDTEIVSDEEAYQTRLLQGRNIEISIIQDIISCLKESRNIVATERTAQQEQIVINENLLRKLREELAVAQETYNAFVEYAGYSRTSFAIRESLMNDIVNKEKEIKNLIATTERLQQNVNNNEEILASLTSEINTATQEAFAKTEEFAELLGIRNNIIKESIVMNQSIPIGAFTHSMYLLPPGPTRTTGANGGMIIGDAPSLGYSLIPGAGNALIPNWMKPSSTLALPAAPPFGLNPGVLVGSSSKSLETAIASLLAGARISPNSYNKSLTSPSAPVYGAYNGSFVSAPNGRNPNFVTNSSVYTPNIPGMSQHASNVLQLPAGKFLSFEKKINGNFGNIFSETSRQKVILTQLTQEQIETRKHYARIGAITQSEFVRHQARVKAWQQAGMSASEIAAETAKIPAQHKYEINQLRQKRNLLNIEYKKLQKQGVEVDKQIALEKEISSLDSQIARQKHRLLASTQLTNSLSKEQLKAAWGGVDVLRQTIPSTRQAQKNVEAMNKNWTQNANLNRVQYTPLNRVKSESNAIAGLSRYNIGNITESQLKEMTATQSKANNGFINSMVNSYKSSLAGRQNYMAGSGFWKNWALNSGMSSMVNWKPIFDSTSNLNKLGKAAGVVGGALGSLSMMFGPIELGMMGISMLMQGIQQWQQNYQENLEKINSELSEARENIQKVQEEFLSAYDEANPNATQDEKDEALLNAYSGDTSATKDDGLQTYRDRLYASVTQIEANTRKKANEEQDFMWGDAGWMAKHVWTPMNEMGGLVGTIIRGAGTPGVAIGGLIDYLYPDSTISEYNEKLESMAGDSSVLGLSNAQINHSEDIVNTLNSSLKISTDRLDKTLNTYPDWIAAMEDVSDQGKYARSIMAEGIDYMGPTSSGEGDAYVGIWGSKSDLSSYYRMQREAMSLSQTEKNRIMNAISEDADFFKSMQKMYFGDSKKGKITGNKDNEAKILKAIQHRLGNISSKQAQIALALSTVADIQKVVSEQVQPTLMSHMEAAWAGVEISNSTGQTVGATWGTTAAVQQGVAVISAQMARLLQQKALELGTMQAELAGIDIKDLDALRQADENHIPLELQGKYDKTDIQNAKNIFDAIETSPYEAVALQQGKSIDEARAWAQDQKKLLDKNHADANAVLNTQAKGLQAALEPIVSDAYIDSLKGSDAKTTGAQDTDKDKSGNDKDTDKDTSNRKNWVNLAICNKKEIPKLNVNLFKKPPNFTILNRNFKLRDVNVNTADDAKSIQNAVKNSIIEIQNRSNPKIIQDDEAEYDPLNATDGNTLPVGTKKTE